MSVGLIPKLVRVPQVERAIDTLAGPAEYDPWGFSREESKFYYSLAYRLTRYFRPRVYGIEHLPAGRVLVVANHSGQLPFDALVIAVSCLVEAEPPRILRPMAERWFPTLPFVNVAFSRGGAVVGDPINCRNLLAAENAILVFPEGAKALGKTWPRRYQLQQFGRGFVRLALQTSTPIVPVAVVGAEEALPSAYNLEWLASRLGMPYFPLPALLPLLGPLAYLPLPTRFHVEFGEPLQLEGPFDDEDEVIQRKADLVKQRIQQMVDEGLRRRQGVF